MSSQYHRRRQVRDKKKTIDDMVDKLSLSKKRLSSSLTKDKDNSRWNLMKSNLWLKKKVMMNWTMKK